METGKVIFNDGTEIEVQINGGTLITDEKPDFPNDLTGVVVSTGEGSTVYDDPKLIECAMGFEPGYGFVFVEKSAEEKQSELIAQNTADLEYIAAMSDIEL